MICTLRGCWKYRVTKFRGDSYLVVKLGLVTSDDATGSDGTEGGEGTGARVSQERESEDRTYVGSHRAQVEREALQSKQ